MLMYRRLFNKCLYSILILLSELGLSDKMISVSKVYIHKVHSVFTTLLLFKDSLDKDFWLLQTRQTYMMRQEYNLYVNIHR